MSVNIEILDIVKDVIRIESAGILGLEKLLDSNFVHSVDTILNTKGKVVVTGMGKSGIIGAKIAATFASTGTPSFFMHPSEAFHGDLGMVGKDDVLLMLSYSGETEEIIRLLPYAKENNIAVVSISGVPKSTLANNSDYFICASVEQEACPLQLAPTASTTAALVIGDALAIALMNLRNFQPENFAKYHPGGSLGRQLLLKVKDVMHTKELPVININNSFIELVQCMTAGKLGVVVVEDQQGYIQGIVSSGDMLRAMKAEVDYRDINLGKILTKTPKCIEEETSLAVAEEVMKKHEITVLLIQNENRLTGMLHISQC